ncbi:hypothetical protein O7600_10965 [Micromonospora sp. WMMA1998]|uniref:Membrane-anchored ribosome-binding protein, inhibits growth in stationary phase, ElaB/YqjD/DUF883 family n=1 Tax=Micromonospora sediminicola TaxID=946078 RepID=A0A1A9B7I7_9ACTN|nr:MULTISPECIES: hypothetical protein [Micromonospora]ATO17032.1 hypothetical protein CO540_26975 [Micromonospora sp. WMMA2032]PGH42163.1 hypothetical protein COO58_20725 [Micromonospora sp. WMMA1996]WBC17311.1 hypothetical protein O7600_10965 [Micromonospora sp. WMMA1998]SBT65063.1 hypothetical protein GA0070622_2053 [Micromonospora sediminicola]
MFGSSLMDRRSKPERVADQAWQHLLSAVGSAGDSVRDATRAARRNSSGLADDATDLVGTAADEARRRASLAFDALAGRRPALPWTLLIAAALAGAAVGWAAGTAARAAGSRDRVADEIEFVDVDRPNSPAGLDG